MNSLPITLTAAERLADPGFGNYMLNGLREITLPPPPSYRPQTVGWAMLAGVTLLSLVVWGIQRYRRWYQNRYRRAALQQLTNLEPLFQQSTTRVEALQKLPLLLKRTALATYPREQVASLQGDPWLTFLDSTYPGQGFTQGNGRLLAQLPYQPPDTLAQLSPETITDLIATTRIWITTHRGGREYKF